MVSWVAGLYIVGLLFSEDIEGCYDGGLCSRIVVCEEGMLLHW